MALDILMKKIKTLLILLLPALFALVGCGGGSNTSTMTPEETLKVLDIQIHKHPKDDNLYYDRAKVYMELGRVNDAIADLSRAVALNEKEAKYHMLLGDAYLSNGSIEQSYASLQRALELEPDNQEAMLKMGEISYYSHNYDRAMECLSKVTAKDPQNRTALFMKGFIYKETGDTANAITLLRKVCDLYPDYEPAFEELGVIYSTHHDPLALEYLNTAIRLEPQNTNALYSLAMYYQELNQMDKAEELYKQILDINPNHKDAWHNRGYIQLFTYGDYPVALDYFNHAIQCDSTFIEAWVNRGCTYELMGDPSQAYQNFHTALDLDHTFQPAIDGIKRNTKK
ncbi:MAG: tetratricopeptide repeat protein [Bacteroidales bacterium]|nr:tetratricopeptide repeat protein [Bacteroidales bacterium]